MGWIMPRQQKNTRYPTNRFTNGQGNTSQMAQRGLLTKGRCHYHQMYGTM